MYEQQEKMSIPGDGSQCCYLCTTNKCSHHLQSSALLKLALTTAAPPPPPFPLPSFSICSLSDSTAAPPVPAEALARARVLIADAMNFRTTRYRTDAVALKVYAFQVHQGFRGLLGNT